MDSLKRFYLKYENFKIQQRLGEDRIMDSLTRFFLPKTKLKFKKGWEKIGLWIPLLFFFQIKKCLNTMVLYESLKRFLFPQISKFENSKKARRR
jgi:hypothetical protein